MDNYTLNQVMMIIAEHLDADPFSITRNTTFDELNADKLDVIELAMAVEEEFGEEIPAIEEGDEVKTIGEFLDAIEEYIE